MSEGETEKRLPKDSYLFIFGFIFVYVAISYLGASTELAAIASGIVIIGAFLVLKKDLVKKILGLKAELKTTKPKVIEAEIVQQEEIK